MKDQGPILIIGAGYSGLALGALCAKRGLPVLLIEGHSLPGGCASYFQRGQSRYDVGATTLSGMAFEGPLWRLYRDLNLQTPLLHQSTAMMIHHERGKIHRYANQDQWIQELHHHFPQLDHHLLWSKWSETSEYAWRSLFKLKGLPPKGPRDFFKLLSSLDREALALAPSVFQTIYQQLSSKNRKDRDYLTLLDQQLLISTQSTTKEVNGLIGALGLMYPSDTYYPVGGMSAIAKELVASIRKNGGEVLFKHKVEKISYSTQGYRVRTNRERELRAKTVVSSIPLWNHLHIGPEEIKNELDQLAQKQPPAWGAMTFYFTVKTKRPIAPLYHQVHFNKGEASYFFSFSDPTDLIRAPAQYQTVTVSTHSQDGRSLPNDPLAYIDFKNESIGRVECLFKERFADWGIQEVGQIECGTPRTFERYTNRLHGRVGGIPHRGLMGLLSYPGPKTRLPNFYRIGDTVFPGQGVVGVISGAYFIFDQLKDFTDEN